MKILHRSSEWCTTKIRSINYFISLPKSLEGPEIHSHPCSTMAFRLQRAGPWPKELIRRYRNVTDSRLQIRQWSKKVQPNEYHRRRTFAAFTLSRLHLPEPYGLCLLKPFSIIASVPSSSTFPISTAPRVHQRRLPDANKRRQSFETSRLR
jgi:hypothetical protein